MGNSDAFFVHPSLIFSGNSNVHYTPLMGPQGLIRCFSLAPAGSHTTIFFPEDRAQLLARWKRDQDRVQGWRASCKKVAKPWIDVDVRAPSAYDALIVAAREALV